MSKHKYRNAYELPTSEEETVVEAVETVESEEEEFCEECQINHNVESEEAPAEEETAVNRTGIVSGCEKLNVRAKASVTSSPLCVINKDDTVIVDTKESTADWYKVCTEAGVEGFCMKQYITITE